MLPNPTWQQQRAQDHWQELTRLASVHRLDPRPRRSLRGSTWSAVAGWAARRPRLRLAPAPVECGG